MSPGGGPQVEAKGNRVYRFLEVPDDRAAFEEALARAFREIAFRLAGRGVPWFK